MKTLDPNGAEARIMEILDQQNDLIHDGVYVEENGPGGHQITSRSSLPGMSWTGHNQYVIPTKATTAQFTETSAIGQQFIEVAKTVADFGGNAAGYMAGQVKAHAEGAAQEAAGTSLYGSFASVTLEFDGYCTRYSSTSAVNGQNVLLGGSASGQTDNATILIVNWGDDAAHFIHPKGSKAGLYYQDLGEYVKRDATLGNMLVYGRYFSWHLGIAVEQWDDVVRIGNLDISLAVAKDASAANFTELVMRGLARLRKGPGPRCRIYCNRTIASLWDIQDRDAVKAGGNLSYENIDGRRRKMFQNTIPIGIMDQMSNAEARIT
jgi:hypothetical protein